jgi:hypothetical protein
MIYYESLLIFKQHSEGHVLDEGPEAPDVCGRSHNKIMGSKYAQRISSN